MKYIIASEKMLLESECCVYPIKETWLGGGDFQQQRSALGIWVKQREGGR